MGIDAATNPKVALFWLEYTSLLQYVAVVWVSDFLGGPFLRLAWQEGRRQREGEEKSRLPNNRPGGCSRTTETT